MDYLDFELEITASPDGGYATRVLRSPAGEASGTMTFPLDTLALQNRLQALQLALLKSGRGRRRIELPETQLVRQFGTELWDALFDGDIVNRFDVSRAEARSRDKGLRVKLRIGAPELAALPWEFLYDSRRGAFLALSATTPLVRYTALPQPIAPLTVVPPLRVLGLIADPVDLDPLDVAREKERLEQALGRLREHGLVELSWVPNGTWRDLVDSLRHGPWHIFHFIGHGGFDDGRREGLIALVDENHRAHRLSASELGLLLGDHDPLRLAVLNSCDSARAEDTDVFSSTAASLVRQGTPAVVAMQYEITDLAAIEFSRSFYEAIADGVPVDSAVSEARKGIAVSISGTLEWGTPVLFSRAPDGALFSIAPEHVASTVIDRSEAPPTVLPTPTPTGRAATLAGPTAGAPPSRLRAWLQGGSRTPWRVLPIGLTVLAVFAVLAITVLRIGSPAGPVLTLSASQAGPGETVRLQGIGYLPGENVNVIVGGVVARSVIADTNGAITASVIVPSLPGPTLDIQAVGSTSGRSSSRSVEMMIVAVTGPSTGALPSPSPPPDASGSAPASLDASLPPSAGVGPGGGPTPTPMRATATPARSTPPPVRPTPSPTKKLVTPTPPPTIHDYSTKFLGSGDHLDADTGLVTPSGSDLRFNQVSANENYLIPENGSHLGYWGTTSPSYSDCKTTSVGSGEVAIGPSNVDAYLCVRTAAGNVTRLQVVALSTSIRLHVWTWK